jgi:dTDP-4-amino-4,6-dideoxygalactose transaminase
MHHHDKKGAVMSTLAILGGEKAVPYGLIKDWPPIDDTDRKYVLSSLEGKSHAFGPNCVDFEKEFAAWLGTKYAITTNSGTAALHMALAACGCGAGDEVIVPAYSWTSSATCVIHCNSIPVFVDIDFNTMNIDVDKIEAAITPKTKAMLIVYLHGLPVDLDKVLDIAKRHNLKVIEDACQAHGSKYRDKKAGLWGDCAAFSFNQNKVLQSGEGGMLVTDDEEIYKMARQVWSFGESRTPMEDRDYHAYALGWMYRNNDLTAAWGRAQLKKLDYYVETQRKNAKVLIENLKDVEGLILPFEPPGYLHNWYNFTCRIDMEKLGLKGDYSQIRDIIVKAIQEEGAPVSMYQVFILPEMTVFQARNAYGQGCPWTCPFAGREVTYNKNDYPNAWRYADTHFGMTTPLRAPNGPESPEAVAAAIRKVLDNLDKLDFGKAVELDAYDLPQYQR